MNIIALLIRQFIRVLPYANFSNLFVISNQKTLPPGNNQKGKVTPN